MPRGPTMQIPNVNAPVKGADALDFARFLRECPIVNGRVVSVTFSASSTAQVRHGLGRRYAGAIVIGQTAQHTQSISAVDPATWELSGNDPTVYLGVAAGSSGGVTYSGTVYLWVF